MVREWQNPETTTTDDNLEATRRLLRGSLRISRDVASQINRAGPILAEMSGRLPSLEAAAKTIAHKCSLRAIIGHIDHAVGPAAAVVKVYDAVHGLERSLLCDPCSDLARYLSLVKQLEEALRLLSENCRLVIRWMEDVVEFLENNAVDDDWYLLKVRKSMRILVELQAMGERSRLDGGPLFRSLQKLETEFRHLLVENSFPVALSSTPQPCISAETLPVWVIQKLHSVIDRLNANNRIEKCTAIYVEVRSSNARAAMQALGLDYLDISLSEFESVQSIEDHVDQWGNHLDFAVKHLFELEYRLCSDVFGKFGSDVWTSCFAEIAAQSGMQAFIKFGNTVTKGKKDAIKLLKLLDIFAALNKLRSHFNRLFGGKACVEIQTQTRDLIKKVVDGACEIFWELCVQVELQRHSDPPSDGSVPRLVSFVVEYCNRLLEDDYRQILIQVLEIRQSWNNEDFDEGLLSKEVHKIMSAIELNLERWGKTYESTSLSYVFRMNSHWYLFNNLKGTQLGDLMGESWLRGHEQSMEYHAAIYFRESWGKFPSLLSEEGLIMFSDGRAIAHDLVKKRLKAFSEAFDDIYKKQSSWVVSDKGLRGKTCQLIVQIIVPLYRSFLQNYTSLGDQGTSPNKYVKYSAESVEMMLSSLFQPRLGKCGSIKCTHLIGKIRNVVTSHFSSTPAAA